MPAKKVQNPQQKPRLGSDRKGMRTIPKNQGTVTPRVPGYRRHKASGKAIVTLSKRDFYLGVYGSPESKECYQEVVAKWLAAGRRWPDEAPSAGLSVNEILLRYVEYCEVRYSGNDSTLWHVRYAVKMTRVLYGTDLADSFGPRKLACIRESMIKTGICRASVNRYTGIVKRCFKWAASQELCPASVWQSLCTLEGLRKGMSTAPDMPPVRAVPSEYVDAIMPFLPRPVAGLVRLQRYTGCRPGEAVQCKSVDIDRSGSIWLWRLKDHKCAWRGTDRVIALGPQAQQVIREYEKPDLSAFLFSPQDTMTEVQAQRAAARKTPLSCGNRAGLHRKRKPRRAPGLQYTVSSFQHSLRKACDAADTAAKKALAERGEKVPEARIIPRWSPNQLRHSYATQVRREFGVDLAASALGHSNLSSIEVYAERSREKLIEIAQKIG